MRTPTVSVVIPTYNRRSMLPATIESVLAQTVSDLELIVVDDGSTDGTGDYVAGLSDDRVRLLALERIGNVAAVRNAGAREASGRYLAFLDHDDLWMPEKLARQVPAMRDAGVRWSYTDYDHCDIHDEAVPRKGGPWRPLGGWIAEAALEGEAAVTLLTVLVERSLFEEVDGFDPDPRIAWKDDFHFTARLALAAPTVAMPGVLARQRLHGDRTSERVSRGRQHAAGAHVDTKLLALTRDPTLRRILKRRRAERYAIAGSHCLREGLWGEGVRHLARAVGYRAPSRYVAAALARGLGIRR